MSFLRNREIYRPMWCSCWHSLRAATAAAPTHRLDEFPAGYSLASLLSSSARLRFTSRESVCGAVVLPVEDFSANGQQCLNRFVSAQGQAQVISPAATPYSHSIPRCSRGTTSRPALHHDRMARSMRAVLPGPPSGPFGHRQNHSLMSRVHEGKRHHLRHSGNHGPPSQPAREMWLVGMAAQYRTESRSKFVDATTTSFETGR